MSNDEQIAKRMDISARSIDLLTTLLEILNNPNGVIQIGVEVGKWLNREQLSESQLQIYCEKARGLALANSQGMRFYEGIYFGKPEQAVGPICTKQSGALGRLIAKDPNLCWTISTVACLFEFHDEKFVTDVLCAFIMQVHLSESGKALDQSQLAWDPLRLQLKPVVEKIVSSVWLNVVNSGVVKPDPMGRLYALALPSEIRNVCLRGHNLESHELGIVLGQLRNIKGEVTIESRHVISNLTIWLIYHFKGHLRVIVSGRIIYDKILGPEERIIEHRAEFFCGTSIHRDSEMELVVKIWSGKTGNLKEIFCGKYDTPTTVPQIPRSRQKLYQSVSYPLGTTGKESIRVRVRQTAFEIVNWLFNLRVVRDSIWDEVTFKVLLDAREVSSTDDGLVVGKLLDRVPGIINMGWQNKQVVVVVFTNIDPDGSCSSERASQGDSSDFDMNPADDESIYSETPGNPGLHLGYFPILRDLLDEIKNSCRCVYCVHPSSLVSRVSKLVPGCLQHTAFMETMLYVAQSISDAFGANDCSGEATRLVDDLGVIRILKEVMGGSMRWKTWFSTASQVVLGCPSIVEVTDSLATEYKLRGEFLNAEVLSGTVVALQHGNIATIAPWVDLSQPLGVVGCFAFRVVEGRLGVVGEDGHHFQSVQGETAVIETRLSESVLSYSNNFSFPPESIGSCVSLRLDRSNASGDFMIVSFGKNRYILLMRICSDSHSRFLDVARAMINISRPTQPISCLYPHSISNSTEVSASSHIIKLYSFDDLLGRWPDAEKPKDHVPSRNAQNADPDEDGKDFKEERRAKLDSSSQLPKGTDDRQTLPTLHISQLMETYLKYNIAIALADDEAIILNEGNACLSCVLEQVPNLCNKSEPEHISRERWVICRKQTPEVTTSVVSSNAKKRIKITA